MKAEVLQHESQLASTLFALGCFWVTPAAVFLTYVGREWRRSRGEMSSWKADAEADAADGFPPPGPPTPDSQPR